MSSRDTNEIAVSSTDNFCLSRLFWKQRRKKGTEISFIWKIEADGNKAESPETEEKIKRWQMTESRQAGSRALLEMEMDARQDLKVHSTHRESLPPGGFWQTHDSLVIKADCQMPIGWVHSN